MVEAASEPPRPTSTNLLHRHFLGDTRIERTLHVGWRAVSLRSWTTAAPRCCSPSSPSRARVCDWRSPPPKRSEEHTSELQSRRDLVCRLLLEKIKSDSDDQ